MAAMSRFTVGDFDCILSDVHCVIEFELSMFKVWYNDNDDGGGSITFAESSKAEEFLKWADGSAEGFRNNIDQDKVNAMLEDLNQCQAC